MRVGVPRERRPGEHRVGLTPTAAASLVARDVEVAVEASAGEAAGHLDGAYTGVGAKIVAGEREAWDADLVVRVGPPMPEELERLPEGGAIAGFLAPFTSSDILRRLRDRHVTGLAFEALPRITAAQAMDALSSQATAAGYAAVLEAADASPKFFPMLTTAAGTVPPAKVLVIGAGVAGLQAIATARRLGAVVSAYDVRPEAAEQIESLGARAIRLEVAADEEQAASAHESASYDGRSATATTGTDENRRRQAAAVPESGYARSLEEDAQARQHELLAPHVADSDVVITTAAVPGRPAPTLITHAMVHRMHAGAVIVDVAAESGGNCEVSYAGERRVHGNGVIICGPTDLPSRVAADASQMYARNVLALLQRVIVDGELVIDLDDDVVAGACVTHRGDVRHPLARELLGMTEG